MILLRYLFLFFVLLSLCNDGVFSKGLRDFQALETNKPIQLIEKIIIDKNQKNKALFVVNREFRKTYLKKNFFIEYDPDIDLTQLDPSLLIVPFIMNVISIIWISGKTYIVQSMDADLYAALEKIREVFKRMYPNTSWLGQLVCNKLVKNQIPESKFVAEKERVALLFSHGLDSVCSSFRYADKEQLLITFCGHDIKLRNFRFWQNMKKKVSTFAQKFGHRTAFARSNYYSFINRSVLNNLSPEIHYWRLNTVEGLGWVGMAAPILLSKGYSQVVIASTITRDCPYPHAANPFIDENISIAGISVKHDAFDMDRVDKCKFIAKFCREKNVEKPFLRVCPKEKTGINCCTCEKCLRTIISFLLAGEDYSPYGFPISEQKVQEALLYEFFEPSLSYFRVWRFKMIQKYMKENFDKNTIEADPIFSWLLSCDFDALNMDKHKMERKINWSDFNFLACSQKT